MMDYNNKLTRQLLPGFPVIFFTFDVNAARCGQAFYCDSQRL